MLVVLSRIVDIVGVEGEVDYSNISTARTETHRYLSAPFDLPKLYDESQGHDDVNDGFQQKCNDVAISRRLACR